MLPILIGNLATIWDLAAQNKLDLADLPLHDEPDNKTAAAHAVSLARTNQVCALMKGQLKTSDLLGAVLDRKAGIRGPGLLTHVAIFELPGLDRLVYLSDSGVIPKPNLDQKLIIINAVVDVAHRFGVAQPRVAILAASNTVHPRFPTSLDAQAITRLAAGGMIKNAVVDGPMGLEVAISPLAAALEGIDSPIEGLADILIVPNVEAGNIAAKGLMYFAHARMAGLVVGAQVPILINSRADNSETRYLSLAMAAVLAAN